MCVQLAVLVGGFQIALRVRIHNIYTYNQYVPPFYNLEQNQQVDKCLYNLYIFFIRCICSMFIAPCLSLPCPLDDAKPQDAAPHAAVPLQMEPLIQFPHVFLCPKPPFESPLLSMVACHHPFRNDNECSSSSSYFSTTGTANHMPIRATRNRSACDHLSQFLARMQ